MRKIKIGTTIEYRKLGKTCKVSVLIKHGVGSILK